MSDIENVPDEETNDEEAQDVNAEVGAAESSDGGAADPEADGEDPAAEVASSEPTVATATIEPEHSDQEVDASPVSFPEVRGRAATSESPLDRVYDLTVPVAVELGKSMLTVQQILQLAPGSVVELDHAADAPVEMYVHGKCVAKGEIVVVDDFYGVRITSVG